MASPQSGGARCARDQLGAANRTMGQVCAAMGDPEEGHPKFAESLRILEKIQSRPELAQTLLAYGRFVHEDGPAEARTHIERALGLFEEIGATDWIDEARAALR